MKTQTTGQTQRQRPEQSLKASDAGLEEEVLLFICGFAFQVAGCNRGVVRTGACV